MDLGRMKTTILFRLKAASLQLEVLREASRASLGKSNGGEKNLLTLRTRAIVLDSLSSKYPNNSASESLPWLSVEFLFVFQSDKAPIGSLPLAYCC